MKASQVERVEKRWRVFAVVAAGVFMSTLDSSMINIALPAIMDEFRSPLPLTQWVVMIYLLTITGTLLVWGHIGDRTGRGRLYPMGMLLFALASLACGLADRISWLICWRFFQALGAAMMMATGPALIKDTSPVNQLGRSLGLVGVAVSGGLMTGPFLGGLLIQYASWRAIFFVTVPIGLLFFALALWFLPRRPNHDSPPPFDLFGSISGALFLILVALATTSRSIMVFPLIGLALLTMLFFLRHETAVPHPILPLELLKKRFFITAVLSALLSFTVLFAVIILVPFFLDRVQGMPPFRIGLVMMAIPVSVLVVGPLAGWLSDYVAARLLTTLGLAISTTGLLTMTRLTMESPPLSVALHLSLLGCGQALFLSPNSASVLGRVDSSKAGISAGMLATARNLGMLLGVALAGLGFSFFFGLETGGLDLKDFGPEHAPAFMTALHSSLLVFVVIGAGGIVTSWFRSPQRRRHKI